MAGLGCSEAEGSKIKVAEPDHGDSGRHDNDTSLEQSSDKIKGNELRCTAQVLIKRRELPYVPKRCSPTGVLLSVRCSTRKRLLNRRRPSETACHKNPALLPVSL